jgi:hypothetical protein
MVAVTVVVTAGVIGLGAVVVGLGAGHEVVDAGTSADAVGADAVVTVPAGRFIAYTVPAPTASSAATPRLVATTRRLGPRDPPDPSGPSG